MKGKTITMHTVTCITNNYNYMLKHGLTKNRSPRSSDSQLQIASAVEIHLWKHKLQYHKMNKI